ncbi:MAG: hypothetical protein A2W63_00750 [Deltaproteobacteria bacterium RIFCSPLOWO2_02_44_9]|nr:MAG: hypothetical protein A2W63_00750 [Deltaproteobacteria bacterium RIFCSPLOWO2_02_44_9]
MTTDNVFNFEKLTVYQKAISYVEFIYKLTKQFPKSEQFGLTDQFRRASVSICLNIAEGSGGSKAEFNQFLKIARRSGRECISITEIAFRQQYINLSDKNLSRAFCVELSKMLTGLMRSLNTVKS